ncbi:hypothetical protein ONZ51_g8323 [Trametes cubensis]|uniref:Uncharacterized protein n=1 Tax=Trametes cubensis TaxID=1111947 RepID=A0AAD7TNV5_9APHY|nr:hypothetical protein ONZ51_g8323 [Trametes cubensis]
MRLLQHVRRWSWVDTAGLLRAFFEGVEQHLVRATVTADGLIMLLDTLGLDARPYRAFGPLAAIYIGSTIPTCHQTKARGMPLIFSQAPKQAICALAMTTPLVSISTLFTVQLAANTGEYVPYATWDQQAQNPDLAMNLVATPRGADQPHPRSGSEIGMEAGTSCKGQGPGPGLTTYYDDAAAGFFAPMEGAE